MQHEHEIPGELVRLKQLIPGRKPSIGPKLPTLSGNSFQCSEWLVEVLRLDLDLALSISRHEAHGGHCGTLWHNSEECWAPKQQILQEAEVTRSQPCRCLHHSFAGLTCQGMKNGKNASNKPRKKGVAWSRTSIDDRPLLGHTGAPSPESDSSAVHTCPHHSSEHSVGDSGSGEQDIHLNRREGGDEERGTANCCQDSRPERTIACTSQHSPQQKKKVHDAICVFDNDTHYSSKPPAICRREYCHFNSA